MKHAPYTDMTRDELLKAFDRIRVWQRGDQRAVHKPLLVLLAMTRLADGEPAVGCGEQIDRPFGTSSGP